MPQRRQQPWLIPKKHTVAWFLHWAGREARARRSGRMPPTGLACVPLSRWSSSASCAQLHTFTITDPSSHAARQSFQSCYTTPFARRPRLAPPAIPLTWGRCGGRGCELAARPAPGAALRPERRTAATSGQSRVSPHSGRVAAACPVRMERPAPARNLRLRSVLLGAGAVSQLLRQARAPNILKRVRSRGHGGMQGAGGSPQA